jgi:hypothetical protein
LGRKQRRRYDGNTQHLPVVVSKLADSRRQHPQPQQADQHN